MNKQTPLGLTVFCVLASLLFLSSCSRNNGATDPPTVFSAKLVKPVDSGDLEKRLKAELIRRYERMYTGYLYYGQSGTAGGSAGVTAGADATGTGTSSAVPHSETNNQEQGVDEGDLVKTDGSTIYLARGTRFFILKANPGDQTAVISDIELKEPISELHLSGGRVAVISNGYAGYPVMTVSSVMPIMPATASTQVYLYDVTTPASPVLTASFVFPGILQGSRRINDTIYLVTNYTIDIPSPVSPWDYLTYDQNSFKQAINNALAENTKKIEALTLDELLPAYTRILYTAGIAGSPFTGPALGYGDMYMPEFGNGTDLSLVISLDISKPDPSPASSGVISSWGRIYMTIDSLYLASDNNWQWIEPLSGVAAPWGNPEPRTAVHKFRVTAADGKPLYRGSGVVDGWVNDRFSMGEYLGYLRIGTTRGGWWGEGISNQLAVLSEEGGELVESGKITGLSPGERIYSMRFDRDRGYMVTFRQTDPLFTLDLSDPKDPKVAGELKVNGVGTYVHLIGQDNSRLLTIGLSADNAGRVTGNKLQLFDVSNLATPQRLAEYDLGPGWSDVMYDPHAFLYYEPLGLLTIPYYSYLYAPSGYTIYSAGLNVFNVDSTGITKRGIISAPTITTGYGSYPDTVDRSVIIGNNIFSIAHRSVTVTGAELLDEKKVLELPESYSYFYTMCCGVATGGTLP